jgi:3-deoxy-D-manno-octulosonic-acid transferase
MIPAFLMNREKYAAGFHERLGNYPEFEHDNRKVIWLHCVSVGETNAARPLVDKLREEFPDHRLVISTTTRTGQELAMKIFAQEAAAIVYFPFDWKFTVMRALHHFNPSLVLLMETEIWPRFIHEAKLSGANLAIVNGRLSESSFRRYSKVRGFISRVLKDVDLAVMQATADADRIRSLGMKNERIRITSNLKFEQPAEQESKAQTEAFRDRFEFTESKPLIIAASTHEPEEERVINSLDGELGTSCRLMIAPRHPERFAEVETLLKKFSYSFVKRTDPESASDRDATIVLLDTIGELRAVYPIAEIVFVGGSLIPHGGQSVIEPALEGKAIVTGPYTANFDSVVTQLLENDALRQIPIESKHYETEERLFEEFISLLENKALRDELGGNAAALMARSNQDAVKVTISHLKHLT